MKKYIVTVNGKKFEVEIEEVVQAGSKTKIEEVRKETAASFDEKEIKSPMPGTILDVKVSAGDKVKKGDVLFILEAMKMENEIMASEDGVISEVFVNKGASVATDDILAKYK
ncbi:MAG: biotin/lipoyl-binding protein [Clostridiales bacterium]|nr:biotin/lipoyl-binding protein [Clostridiales bacterium]